MNNKFLKILTGFSAIAVAGVLSFIPAKAVNAGTVSNTMYYINENDGNGSRTIDTGVITDYSVSSDLQELYYDLTFDNYGDCTSLNVWLNTCNASQSFELHFLTPCNLPELSFERYYYDFYDEYVYGDCGFLNSFSINGNTVYISGTSSGDDTSFSSAGYFDVLFSNRASSPYISDEDDIIIREFYNSINTTADDIIKAAQGINHDGSENPQKVVFYNCNGAINYRIINALANAQGVTLFYTFEYEGYVFTSAITSEMASQILIEGEDWYGCCYIAKHCPTIPVDVVK
ncbi:MAG: hypothetical protein J6I66_06640 [Lachnospiraceae bacterium]|nr:hypothetical protein [Lachnospiraceae bacterium]